jgi:hypothetical protein
MVTKFEVRILLLFAFSLLLNHFLQVIGLTILVFYLLGMLFETLTEKAWNYNPVLTNAPFTVKGRDINLTFGTGWASVAMLGLTFSKYVVHPFWITGSSFWADVVGIGIVGNLLEQIFYAWKLWSYNNSNWIISLWLKRPIYIAGLPLTVRLGYFAIIGVIASLIFRHFS